MKTYEERFYKKLKQKILQKLSKKYNFYKMKGIKIQRKWDKFL